MSAPTFTIVDSSFTLGAFIRTAHRTKAQHFNYVVREANGAEYKVSSLWNTSYNERPRVPVISLRSNLIPALKAQANLLEQRAHGVKLTPAQLRAMRFSATPVKSRVCIKEPPKPPAPAPAPTLTPAAIAATIETLKTQIRGLTEDLVNLKKQLQQTNSDNVRLTQMLQATQAQLDRVTAALKIALAK